MSKLVNIPGPDGIRFAAIERDDGTLVFGDDFAPPGGTDMVMGGVRHLFVPKSELAEELQREGLQPVYRGRR